MKDSKIQYWKNQRFSTERIKDLKIKRLAIRFQSYSQIQRIKVCKNYKSKI